MRTMVHVLNSLNGVYTVGDYNEDYGSCSKLLKRGYIP